MSCETCKKLRVNIKKWLNIEPEIQIQFRVYQTLGTFRGVGDFTTEEDAQAFIDHQYKLRPRDCDWAFTIMKRT